jgi:hypothetical protein
LLIIGTSWIVFIQVSSILLSLMYEDRLLPTINDLLSNKSDHSLEHYIDRMRGPIAAIHVLSGIVGLIFITRRWRRPLITLVLFLAGDVILLIFSQYDNIALLNLSVDWSIPEFFQYFKEVLIATVMLLLLRRSKNGVYLVFTALAVFMFVDDAFKYHEQIGHLLSPAIAKTSWPDVLQIAPNYIGEVLSLAPLILISPFAVYSFFKADRQVQTFAIVWCLLLGLLVIFGVVFDFLAHSGMTSNESTRTIMAALEDFGEMVVMSMIVAFVSRYFWLIQKKSVE